MLYFLWREDDGMSGLGHLLIVAATSIRLFGLAGLVHCDTHANWNNEVKKAGLKMCNSGDMTFYEHLCETRYWLCVIKYIHQFAYHVSCNAGG